MGKQNRSAPSVKWRVPETVPSDHPLQSNPLAVERGNTVRAHRLGWMSCRRAWFRETLRPAAALLALHRDDQQNSIARPRVDAHQLSRRNSLPQPPCRSDLEHCRLPHSCDCAERCYQRARPDRIKKHCTPSGQTSTTHAWAAFYWAATLNSASPPLKVTLIFHCPAIAISDVMV